MGASMGLMQKVGDAIRSNSAAARREESTSLEAAMQEEKKATSMENATSLEAALQEEVSTTTLAAAPQEKCTGLPPRLAPPWTFTVPRGILARLKPPTVQRWGRTERQRERPLSQSRNPLPGAAKATDEPGRGERREKRCQARLFYMLL